ncbi:MAG: TetR/AcrR family transcriptional regulator [Pseudomonadota bacterium]
MKTSQDLSDTRTVILDRSIPLFAARGYSAVSMRDIAGTMSITPAALYHHYPSKQSLYLAAMERVFADKARVITETVRSEGTARQRLERFIDRFTLLMAEDPDFRMLLQRELLDGDSERLRLLAEHAFAEPFAAVSDLVSELAPECDPHLMTISLAGLVLFHFEAAPLRQFLPGMRAEHDQPEIIARHITRLMVRALDKA